MSTYRTPGVYVKEVSVFPPSVAAVDTAVPAFIGYVYRAERRGTRLFIPAAGGDPAVIRPTEINSLPQFEEYFGREPHRSITVELDSSNEIVGVTSSSRYLLYDSIRTFFLNGGRKCYIVPVGLYSSGTPVRDEVLAGLTALRLEDEPTLIVIPDAVSLPGNEQYEVYVQALRQCAELQDRFTICDLANVNGLSHDEVVTAFRNNIGINHLSYGAAYTPWLKSTLSRNLYFRDITFMRGANQIFLQNLTSDYNIRLLLKDLNIAIATFNTLNTTVVGSTPLGEQFTTLVDGINQAIAVYDPVGGTINSITTAEVRSAYNRVRDLLAALITLRDSLPQVAVTPDLSANETRDYALRADISNILQSNGMATAFARLLHHSNGAPLTGAAVDIFTDGGGSLATVTTGLSVAPGATDPAITALYPAVPTPADAPAIARIARAGLEAELPAILATVQAVRNAAERYERIFDESLPQVFAFYKNALTRIIEDLSLIPPSGVIAGVYASTDAARGVSKAPANSSLTGVNGLAVNIDNQMQEGLNIDPNAGKSINAIRAFAGKGVLVWGARTLAGNDNEWRYINVRRFFIFAEESIKKATEPFVFEPNDANTWVKVRAMIENFLTVQWRQGALAGAKPDEAFFVKVGLGQTMTAQDILNGYMIVEIGMAVVRPAEFIVLRFSHKMQES